MVDATSPDENNDVNNKIELALFSYQEVLDATKHQDDKIGRMITGIAFLTAAALSLAALGGAQFVTRSFHVRPFYLPLGLISLIVFLVGVIFTVLLLLGSLATPLRIPGLGEEKTRTYFSQIYFYPISKISVDSWMTTWQRTTEDLKKERLQSLIREIHNLAVRTTFKYNRGTEAVSMLSFSLLTLGLAATFVSISAGTSGDTAIELSPLHRWILGVLLGGYCTMQLLIRVKYDSQEVKDRPQPWTLVRNPRTFACILGLFVLVSTLFDQGWPLAWPWGHLLVLLLGIIGVVSYFLAAPTTTITKSEVGEQFRSNRLTIPIALAVATVCVIAFMCFGWYAAQFGIIVALVFMLNLVQIIATDRRTRPGNRSATGSPN